MDETRSAKPLSIEYDAQQDTLYLLFTAEAREGVGEEIGDEVFLRFDPESRQIVNIEMLNFRARLEQAFGPELVYTGQTQVEQLQFLPAETPSYGWMREATEGAYGTDADTDEEE